MHELLLSWVLCEKNDGKLPFYSPASLCNLSSCIVHRGILFGVQFNIKSQTVLQTPNLISNCFCSFSCVVTELSLQDSLALPSHPFHDLDCNYPSAVLIFKQINGSFVPIFPLSKLFHFRLEMQGSCYYLDIQGSLLSTHNFSFVCYLIKT